MFRCSNSDSGLFLSVRREGSGKGDEKEERKKGLLPHLTLDFYLLGKEIQF